MTLLVTWFKSGDSAKHTDVMDILEDGFKLNDIYYSINDIKIHSRIANTPRRVDFSDGISVFVYENEKFDKALQHAGFKTKKTAHHLESKMHYALLSLAILLLIGWWTLFYGADFAANIGARYIPSSALNNLSEKTMKFLDDEFLGDSKLTIQEKQKLQAVFDRVTSGDKSYKLHFRSAYIGPNAFALPNGDIVLLDDLVKLSTDKEYRDIAGVLAHEQGHVVYKHSLKNAIKTTISGAMAAYFVGDVSALANGLGAFMINGHYSREHEREADKYALDRLHTLNIDTKPTAKLFEELQKLEGEKKGEKGNDIFATHPDTSERIKLFRDGK